jgi:hypothetical protein
VVDPNLLQSTFEYTLLRFDELVLQARENMDHQPQTFEIPEQVRKELELLLKEHSHH